MKKIYLCIILCLVCTGCSDLLNKYPVGSVNPHNFWKTGEQAKEAVNALYTYLPGIHQVFMDRLAGIAVIPTTGGNDLIEGHVTVKSNIFFNWWRKYYNGVAAANRFIKNIKQVPKENITDKLFSRLVAQARFIRAVNYTFLVNLFGDVPLYTKPLTIEEASKLGRTDKKKVIDFIHDELTDVSKVLPLKYTSNNVGRITKGAALAWLARAMLWEERYKKAAQAAKAVMDLHIYSLCPDYTKLFRYDGEYNNNHEIILARIYTKNTPNNFMHLVEPYGLKGHISNALKVNVTDLLVRKYETINGLAPAEDPTFNPMNPYKNRDPRLEATIWIPLFKKGAYADTLWGRNEPFDVRPGSGSLDEVLSLNVGDFTGYLLKKYTNPEDVGNARQTSQNFIILRYADVLLMYAESKIELNEIDASVIKAINRVRARVGLPTLQASGVNVHDQDAMRKAVRHERTVELGMEGWHLFDIRRWGIAEDILPNGAPIPGMSYIDIKTSKLKTVEWNGSFWNFPKKNEDYLFPIPFKALNRDPKLSQNPGW